MTEEVTQKDIKNLQEELRNITETDEVSVEEQQREGLTKIQENIEQLTQSLSKSTDAKVQAKLSENLARLMKLQSDTLKALSKGDTGDRKKPSCQEVFKMWREQVKLEYAFEHKNFRIGGEICSNQEDAINRLCCESESLGNRLSASVARQEMGNWLRVERKKALTDLRRRILKPELSQEAGDQYLRSLLECISQRPERIQYDMAVLKHFVWQVKRKLAGMNSTVVWHMMPILVGKSGSGKSWVVENLVLPAFAGWWRGFDLAQLADERQHATLAENYIGYLDEMASGGGQPRSNYTSSLKKIISAINVDPRKLYSETAVKIPQNCTFIGTCEVPISSIIYDQNSGRRFWNIFTKDSWDFSITESMIDGRDALWASVDVTQESPLTQYQKEILEIQVDENQTVSVVEEWLDERGYKPGPGRKLYINELYNDFYDYCVEEHKKKDSILGRGTLSKTLQNKYGFSKARSNRGFYFSCAVITQEKGAHEDSEPAETPGDFFMSL